MRITIAVVALVLLLLLALVALSLFQRPELLPELESVRGIPRLSPGALVALLAATAAALASGVSVVLLQGLRRRATRRRTQEEAEPRESFILLFVGSLVAALVLMLALAFVASLFRVDKESKREGPALLEQIRKRYERPLEQPPQAPPAQQPVVSAEGSAARAILLATLAVVVTGVAVAGVRYVRGMQRSAVHESSRSFDELAAGLAHSARLSLDQLGREVDYRRAVIMAYAFMEQTFAGHGLPRRPDQTPLEYMEETLQAVSSRAARQSPALPAGALLALTGLYEVAKFSEHPVGPAERQRAMEHLRAIVRAVPDRRPS